ncbi:vitelline envelope sperm lysin receptor-like [Haliotis cracherodii]|uniref:vitelline envelope sperm lysin receptor-like n=1 Tax=Haliotis cracherodii TaxID=6455 RepID=UPI0039EC2AC3
MEVVDILNHQVSRLLLGKKIRLKLNTSGAAGELGLRPSSCDMVGSDTGHRYALLRAGCGDGIIFPRRSGFISYGLEAFSPYFESVTLSAESYLKFECNFTLCSSMCGGSSCVNERRRRNDMEHGHSDMRKSTKKTANIITVFTTIGLAKSLASSIGHPFNSLEISTTPELSTTASCSTVTAPRGGNVCRLRTCSETKGQL